AGLATFTGTTPHPPVQMPLGIASRSYTLRLRTGRTMGASTNLPLWAQTVTSTTGGPAPTLSPTSSPGPRAAAAGGVPLPATTAPLAMAPLPRRLTHPITPRPRGSSSPARKWWQGQG
ncbi:unnamed protein product, partial [Discosporangium mesarthrocarpum]